MEKRLTVILIMSTFFAIACSDKNRNGLESEETILKYKTDTGFLEFDKRIYNADTISSDTIIKAVYHFKNTGNDTVQIEYVNPECTCTGFYLSTNLLSPGDTGFIELLFNTSERKGLQKTYTVVKTDTKERFYRLLLKVYIK
jgi:hypothetical protein